MGKLLQNGCISLCVSIWLCSSWMTPATAADLRIGFKAEVTSGDPHVLNGQNRNVWAHVYESLIGEDAKLRPQPKLALSWSAITPTVWEFKLRPNVHFHNGETMTAQDVKYSIERAMHLSGPRTYRTYLKGITAVNIGGPLTVRIVTDTANPTLPDNIGLISIIPHSLDNGANEESFANGRAAIGTGPYKFSSWSNGQKVVLSKNADYWGEREPWDTVTFQFIPREPARAAALLSGSVDIIDGATANLTSVFRASNQIAMTTETSYMLNYLSLDQGRKVSPFLTDNDGQPLQSNPLQVPQVRQALMSAISREGIVRFIMKRDGTVSDQLVPDGFFGHDASLKLPPYDVAKARALLAAGGYPQGFQMSIHCPNNRYVNDARICEAAAQLFSQIGIKTEVVTMPFSVFLSRASGGANHGVPEFSVFLLGAGAVIGDSLTVLVSTIHSYDKQRGLGANNYARYSNAQVDRLIEQAQQTLDPVKRDALQEQAQRLALEDGAMIPLLQQNATWAYRKGLHFTPRADGFTMAMDVRPK